ncbi:MAG TPA: PDDEXK nuclease domain-containing protein [Gemmataceae bacterium]|jgi:predicted nuclease of restriction endonuclease-like (RecB) superfamily|nr:PDDEXK nuclease domain-containing protein [Gemmataceae bacterium]
MADRKKQSSKIRQTDPGSPSGSLVSSRQFAGKTAAVPSVGDFEEVTALIEAARKRAFAAVNHELVSLYWQIGEYISLKIESAAWGEGVVAQLAGHIARTQPDLRGFERRNLFRMRQFFETYRGDEKVSALLTQLPWTHNLLILSRSTRPEEREFYLRMAVRERWNSRDLARQLNSALFERVVLSPAKVSPPLTQLHADAVAAFKDTYLVDFLNLPKTHTEADLQRALAANLRHFLMELGGDFTFVGERYRLQVGSRDFFVDLLFYHRGLTCLVAFELKVEQFEPADLGQLQFYLEALDRDVKKPHEKPSIGVLLCATKDNEVVEYALSRTVSPALVAEYQTRLPDKTLLQTKLHEFYELAQAESERPALEEPKLPKAKRTPQRKRKKPHRQ